MVFGPNHTAIITGNAFTLEITKVVPKTQIERKKTEQIFST